MSMVNRAAGRSSKTGKTDTNPVVTKNVKTDTIKTTEKEKKQPTPEQIRLASLTDRGETQNADKLQDKINKIKEFTHKTEDEVVTALHDCDYCEQEAITYLLEGKTQGWSDPVTKKKKSRTASASKNEAEANNGDAHENSEDWDKEANSGSGHHGDKGSRGYRGGRRGMGRSSDRGSFQNRRWKGRENKENERNNEDGGAGGGGGSGRDYRGRGDRLSNGPSRMGRGGRGSRGGRGPGGTRTFQSRDNNDRSGGFPRQIDTWNNPETETIATKADEFPSPEDWDNEEYTGSLADTKVFTPSTAVEPEGTDTPAVVESEIKEESLQIHMSLQATQNAPIPTLVVGSNQLTPAQTQYFKQLTAQASENRKQAQQQTVPQPSQAKSQVQQPPASVIYNSSMTSPQQGYAAATTQSSFTGGVSQSYASVTPSQSFTAMVSSQTFPQPPSESYQSPSSMSGTVSYTRNNSEYTSSNYSDVISNYNSIVGLQTNGALPQRSKSQRPTSRQETPSKVIPGSVDIPSADGSMNSAMKYLDAQFSALDFNSTGENYDSTATASDPSGVAALSNKFAQSVSATATPHADLTTMNSFQATQSKQSHQSTNISSVLNQNSKLSAESALQNDSSVYSSANSRIASGLQNLGNSTEVSSLSSYGISDSSSYQSSSSPSQLQSQQQTSYQSTSSSVPSAYHQSGSLITSTASNVYSSQQVQQAQQPTQSQQPQTQPQAQSTQPPQQTAPQQQQQQQQPSQITSGVTYTTNNTSTSFSVYSSNNHSVATATPPNLHNSVYHNSSYAQQHPSVTASFPSYMSYPGSIIQPYQAAGAAGLTQAPYLSTQYGGGSLASLGATYGAAPFHNNYGVNSSLQTPVVTLQQNHKISNSLSTNAASKDSQYDSLQPMTSVSGGSNTATTTTGSGISGLTQASTTTSSKISSSSSSGSKSGSILPSMPPGVAPLLGPPAGPQYIMGQTLYQPAFTFNYDDLSYLRTGIPHMPGNYIDLNYATAQQTNLATTGRETLNVPFSSISDGRYTRPDNTTSPVPPTAGAAGASLSQQNAAPTHQQPHVPMLQTYAAAYIYPPYQQYATAPVYQVTPTATAAAPGASSNAAITGTPFGKAGYSSTGYASQYDSMGSNQSSGADYTGKGSSSNSYSSSQQQSKSGGSSGAVSGQASNVNNADLSIYGKSHASLTKTYENKAFHSGTPPPFTMTGSGSTSNNLGNVSNVSGAATGYGPQLYIPNVQTAATAAHQQHHLHQNSHHQDGADMRNTGTSERNFFLSSNRPSYR